MTYYEIDHKLSIYADSSETKPTVYKTMSGKELPIPGGSTLYVTDTGDLFMWNDLKSKWDPQ